MKIAVLCEYSGIVRDAFLKKGHDVISCDILDTESPGPHFKGDVFEFLNKYDDNYFDIIIMHPPCTYLALSGNRHYAKSKKREKAIKWTVKLWNIACKKAKKVALENPASVIFSYLPNVYYVQPWMFGHGEVKKTGFCLKNLNPLQPSNIVDGREQRIWKMSPTKDRSKLRSKMYIGMADAMADQWTMKQIIQIPLF